MYLARACFSALNVLLVAALPAAAQSVVCTHAGVVHYFEGAVSIGGATVHPQFGRFPDIPEGAELRTAAGRAEILLGPGVILRVAEDSAIKMIASALTDTRLEMLSGTAILESKDPLPGNSSVILYKDWQVRVAGKGAYRIDTNPEQIRAYDGTVEVRTAQDAPATVKAGQTLPLASILVADDTVGAPGDAFNSWSFDRSEAINADNAMAAQIVDDPALYPDLSDASGLAMAGYTYFPTTPGTPYMSTGTYGAWNPYVGNYYGYIYGASLGYTLRSLYPGTGGVTLPLRLRYPSAPIYYHPGGGIITTTHPVMGIPPRPVTRTVPMVRPAVPVHH